MDLEKLQRRIGQTRAELEQARELKERREARDKLIDEAPEWTRTDFWCSTCNQDILGCRAYKVVQSDWTAPGQRIAFYEAYKGCHKLRRYITDKHQDPYYRKSQMLKEQWQDHARDLLQPGDPGFNMYYGDPNKQLYEQMEAKERASHQRKTIVQVS